MKGKRAIFVVLCILLLTGISFAGWEWYRHWLYLPEVRQNRYEELKERYYPQGQSKGVYVDDGDYYAWGLTSCVGNSPICAVVEVLEGCESSEITRRELLRYYREVIGEPRGDILSSEEVLQLLEEHPDLMWEAEAVNMKVKVEEYLYDRTGRFLKEMDIQQELRDMNMPDYGKLPAFRGMRMVLFLDVTDSGKNEVNLRWNYIISEKDYVVPMTEYYGDLLRNWYVEENHYVGMWEYGGYYLRDYLDEIRSCYDKIESEINLKWTIYQHLNQELTASVDAINGSQVISDWKIIEEEMNGNRITYRLAALVEDFWIDEILQQKIGIGGLVLQKKDNGYSVISDSIEWQEVDIRNLPDYIKELAEKEEVTNYQFMKNWENAAERRYQSWKYRQIVQKRYEKIREATETAE